MTRKLDFPEFSSNTPEPDISLHAGFSARLMAFLIDCALLTALQLMIYVVFAAFVVRFLHSDLLTMLRVSTIFLLLSWLTPVFFATLYFTFLHALLGQTIGKIIMGIQVVSNANGTLSIGMAFLRCVGYILSALPAYAGFLWSVVDKGHRGWHDLLADSRVVLCKMA